jgi:Ca-activated chloride channel family protein
VAQEGSMSTLSWLEPRALWLLLLLLPLWLRPALGVGARASRRLSLALRALTMVVLTLALAQPVASVGSEVVSTVFVVDVSASIDDAALRAAERYIVSAADEHSQVVSFARAPRRIARPVAGAPFVLARHGDDRASDLERALALATGLLEPSTVQQVVLFSDGRETHGRLQHAAAQLQALGVPLWVADGPDASRPEVAVIDLSLPDALRVGEPFELGARVVASTPIRVQTRWLQNGASEPDGTRVLTLPAGESALSLRSRVRKAGPVRYRLELTPEPADTFVDNNHFERAAVVRGPPRVLYVEREPAQAYALLDVLRAAGFEVVLRTPEQAPRSPSELAEVDFYILSDVPASALSRASSAAIEHYVQRGGAFMMAGGERAFGPGGYAGTPLEPLLPVSLDASARREQASLALVLAIDKSGSMAGEKLERAKEAAIATAALLKPDAYLGVIGFDVQPEQLLRLGVGQAGSTVARKLGSLSAGGGTAIFPALDAAYGALAGVQARVKHVVLLTDGQTEEEALGELIRSMAADGITVSTIGLGEEVNRGLLTELARLSGGRAYFTRDPSKVPRLFAEETQLVARPVLHEQRVHARRVGRADFLKGIAIDRAPALRGFVPTRPRAAPAELLLATEGGEPLLARMRVGQGWSLAWTADLKPRWAADWFSFRDFSPLLAQLVREHSQHPPTDPLPIEVRVRGDQLEASIEVQDAHGSFVNGLTGALEVRDDRGQSRETELLQAAPGRYHATLPLPRLGVLALRAQLLDPAAPERPALVATGQASHAFPAEFQPPFEAASGALAAAAARTGGGQLPQAGDLMQSRGRHATRPVSCWQALLWLGLGLFLLELLVRRTARLGPSPSHGT